MTQSILLPILALFIGGCSSIVGLLYMRFLPGFPLFAWWFQFLQRWETNHPNLFKVLAICADCFSGHVAWIIYVYWLVVNVEYNRYDLPIYAFSIGLASGAAIFFSQILNDCLDDIKARKNR